MPEEKDHRLHKGGDGTLEGLHLAPLSLGPPAPGEVQVEVQAAGLNYRDVLNVLGMYPGDAGLLGGELSGRVTAVRRRVTGLQVGDEVMGLAAGAFTTRSMCRRPCWSPNPWGSATPRRPPCRPPSVTAQLAFQRAGLRAGERVLIHAG